MLTMPIDLPRPISRFQSYLFHCLAYFGHWLALSIQLPFSCSSLRLLPQLIGPNSTITSTSARFILSIGDFAAPPIPIRYFSSANSNSFQSSGSSFFINSTTLIGCISFISTVDRFSIRFQSTVNENGRGEGHLFFFMFFYRPRDWLLADWIVITVDGTLVWRYALVYFSCS